MVSAQPAGGGRSPVTLNITLTPGDVLHAQHVLPHQLRVLADQVDEVQLVVNLGPEQAAAPQDAERKRRLDALLETATAGQEHVHVRLVDYADRVRAEVADRFYGGRALPLTNHDGGPFYSYWYGWHAARNDRVLHTDSDILFGGGSRTWVAEACAVLDARSDVLAVSPLAGPPTHDGELPADVCARHARWGSLPVRQPGSLCYAVRGVSTRVWLFDRVALVDRLGPVPLARTSVRSQLRARIEGHPPYELPEKVLTHVMREQGFVRFDMLGSDPGLWSLHPSMRSPEFYDAVPDLVRRVESGDVPDAQRGDYDLNDSLVDWTSARAALAHKVWWRRVGRAVRARVAESPPRRG